MQTAGADAPRAPQPPPRSRPGLTFAALAIALVFVAVAVLACLSPAQADTFWALRAGEDLWRTGRVPLADSYSHTAFGRPWPNHEWLWQAALYALHRAGGLPLVTLVVAALVTGAYAIAYRLMRGGPRLRGALLAAAAVAGSNAWVLRPHVTSLFLLAALVWLLVREREALVPPLFVLWANLHGGVVLGGFVLVAVTVAAWFGNRARFRRLLAVTVLGGAATALTPLGPGLWTFVLRWSSAAGETGVSEWSPVYPVDAQGIVFWLLALGFCALVARQWRRRDLGWADRLLVVAALALLPFAARSLRNVAPFLLVAAPAAARLAAGLAWLRRAQAPAGGSPIAAGPPRADSPRLNLAILAAGVLGAIAVVGVAWARPLPLLGWRPMSAAARDAVAACPDPLYNGYNQGGDLLWFVKGKRVFIDGRHDPYPPAFIVEDHRVETGQADFRPLFDRFGVRCAALAADASLAARLEAAGWRRRFADGQWLVLDRGGASEN